jgi:hypothetical protein
VSATEVQLAYTAGIIDGEGYFVLVPRAMNHRKYGKYQRYNAVVGIKHTKRELLEWMKEKFGGNIYGVPCRSIAHAPSWEWRVTHLAAAAFVQQIMPYLLLKKRNAELILEVQGTAKRWGKWGVPSEVLDRREAMYAEMKSLNKRGPKDAMERKIVQIAS